MFTAIIADDEKLICDAIQSVIHTAVPELTIEQTFYDGDDVYDYVSTHKVDFMLLDIEMPGRTGLDIAQLVREQQSDCYVIIITAYHEFDYAKRAIDCNVNSFLTKPFTSKQLIDALQKGISHFEQKYYLAFAKEMSGFFQLIADGSSHQAKKQLTRYICALSAREQHALSKFISDTYQVSVNGTADAILQSLDVLINRSLNTPSGNMTVDLACEYIRNHYSSSSISLEAVADSLHVSNAYLSRAFKKYINQNFSEYLLNIRMEQASHLLRTTDLPSAEIAESIGYDNAAYFRASFKTVFGMTPKQYRHLEGRKDERNL